MTADGNGGDGGDVEIIGTSFGSIIAGGGKGGSVAGGTPKADASEGGIPSVSAHIGIPGQDGVTTGSNYGGAGGQAAVTGLFGGFSGNGGLGGTPLSAGGLGGGGNAPNPGGGGGGGDAADRTLTSGADAGEGASGGVIFEFRLFNWVLSTPCGSGCKTCRAVDASFYATYGRPAEIGNTLSIPCEAL